MTKKRLLLFVVLCSSALMFAATPDYLCFTAQTDNSAVSLQCELSDWTYPQVEWSYDADKWDAFVFGRDTIRLENAGDMVYFRGQSGTWSFGTDRYAHFTMSGSIAASGNVMSLVDPTCASTSLPRRACFVRLFEGCTALTSAPELPATELKEYGYYEMFKGCTNLEEAPVLPAETLTQYCYAGMFEGCSNMDYMEVNFTQWSPENATMNWVKDVAEEGMFICSADLDTTLVDESHVPFGWERHFMGCEMPIVQLFEDVVAIDIVADSYQWYRDGEPIEGATGQYYQEEGGLKGNYYVVINGGKSYYDTSCDRTFPQEEAEQTVVKRVVDGNLVVILENGDTYDAQGNRL